MTESELMNYIFERPAMYLGHRSIVKMESFIDGFAFASSMVFHQEKDVFFEGFRAWVSAKIGVGQYSWSSVISMVGITEEGAFNLARELWEEYKAEMRKSGGFETKAEV